VNMTSTAAASKKSPRITIVIGCAGPRSVSGARL
jgi:hypothetical protein